MQIPSLIVIFIKTTAGIRAWFIEDFNRKAVERYFISTFVYHAYTVITNTIMFSFQYEYYGQWLIPNIIMTVAIGGLFVMILWKFMNFKDRDATLHQQLWCGDVVDSSDEEEANKNAEKYGTG